MADADKLIEELAATVAERLKAANLTEVEHHRVLDALVDVFMADLAERRLLIEDPTY